MNIKLDRNQKKAVWYKKTTTDTSSMGTDRREHLNG